MISKHNHYSLLFPTRSFQQQKRKRSVEDENQHVRNLKISRYSVNKTQVKQKNCTPTHPRYQTSRAREKIFFQATYEISIKRILPKLKQDDRNKEKIKTLEGKEKYLYTLSDKDTQRHLKRKALDKGYAISLTLKKARLAKIKKGR